MAVAKGSKLLEIDRASHHEVTRAYSDNSETLAPGWNRLIPGGSELSRESNGDQVYWPAQPSGQKRTCHLG